MQTPQKRHVVFVDNTATGVLAFRSAKRLGCHVSFVKPLDSSFVDISFKDPAKLRAYIEHVDTYVEVADLDVGTLRPVLEQLHADRPIDAIVTMSEAAILAVAREAEHFGTIYPGHAALGNAVYKDLCRARLRAAGLRSPRFEALAEADLLAGRRPAQSLPYVIKPTRGFGKQFSAICTTADDVEAFVANVARERKLADPMIEQLISHEYIVEEYVRGTLYSVEALVQDGTVSCLATTLRFRSSHNEMLEMTTTMPSDLDAGQRQEMVDYVQQVFDALDIDVGLYHVEIMRDAAGPCLIEVNGRMIGGVAPRLYQMLSGHDPFELLLRLHLGERIDVDDSALRGGGTTVVVGTRKPSKVRNDFAPAQLEALMQRYGVEFSSLSIRPGQEFGEFAGNLSLIGYVIIVAEDALTAARNGHRFLCELEQLVGFELARFNPPGYQR
jgi:biotin carboxylase